jgi:hypothetical protein
MTNVREFRRAVEQASEAFDKAVDVARMEYQSEMRRINADFMGEEDVGAMKDPEARAHPR